MTRRLLIACTLVALAATPAAADPVALLEEGFAAYRTSDWATARDRCQAAEAAGLQGRFLADALFCQADARLKLGEACAAEGARAATTADDAATTDTTASAEGLRTMRYRSHLVAARCALAAQDPVKAAPHAETAAGINPTKEALFTHCAAQAATQASGAVAACEAAAAAMPQNANAVATLGVAYGVAGRTDDARATLRQALALDPANAIATKALAELK